MSDRTPADPFREAVHRWFMENGADPSPEYGTARCVHFDHGYGPYAMCEDPDECVPIHALPTILAAQLAEEQAKVAALVALVNEATAEFVRIDPHVQLSGWDPALVPSDLSEAAKAHDIAEQAIGERRGAEAERERIKKHALWFAVNAAERSRMGTLSVRELSFEQGRKSAAEDVLALLASPVAPEETKP